tara:strand:+ start:217 stop:363 length:147 start_codon:yes stop_codon:yes gene_type:complete
MTNDQHPKMLREISNDNIVPKKTDKNVTNDLYEKVEDNEIYEMIDLLD